ncbi:MAG: VWA domain-containing protein [Fuerstiella sp.]|nr:VWA domain-containing protein [Fuerstiella sp.]MCP4853258.1 VWA domain-containing protein [Fuerstiella sp.]
MVSFHMVATPQYVSIPPSVEKDVLRRQDETFDSVMHPSWPLRQQDCSGGEESRLVGLRLLEQIPAYAVSLIVHVAVLLACSAIYLTVDFEPPELVATTIVDDLDELDEELLLQDLTQELDAWRVDPDAPVTTNAITVAETATSRQIQEKQLTPLVEDEVPPEPVSFGDEDVDLTEIIEGVQGAVVQTEGDVGSVDRITMEIVHRLREKKLVVAWLMDASESLRTRREQVISRFERVYKELDELAEDHEDRLLTSITAFGQQSVVMTDEPTADRKVIQQAVQEIPLDESGVENVFTAIRAAALDHRGLARKGYEVMIVLLTDECGNDFEMLEDALQQVKHNKMPVFVMGPMAPFGRHEVKVPWTDPETKEVHYLPVERGPESIRFEYPTLPSWNEALRDTALSSGFGSYGLAHITRESGGIYFLHQDRNLSDAGIDFSTMLDYSPDYVSTTEYMTLIRQNPARQAVLAATDASRTASWEQPRTKFLASGIQFDIRDDQDTLMKIAKFLDDGIEELRSAEEARGHEDSQRWRAHYDLLMGRLLANRARLNNTIPLLNEMYTKPKVCRDGTTNAWELVGLKGSALRDEPKKDSETADSETAVEASGNEQTQPLTDQDQGDVVAARVYLQRVEAEHPGTPWSTLARLELDAAVDFKWQEAFIVPPAGEKLPWDKKPWKELSNKQKEAKRKFERFQQEKTKRVEKKEEQAREVEAGEKKKTRIPKL